MKKIKLTKGKWAIVDDDDYNFLSKYKWFAQNHSRSDTIFYAKTTYIGKMVAMHRLLLGAKPDQFVDHINGNGLDNRKKNLRFCTKRQNSSNSKLSVRNTSGYKGVCFYKNTNKWAARIGNSASKGNYHLGFFDSKEQAARAYNKEAKKRYGDFAYINKIK